MTNHKKGAEVFITKVAASQRLLDAAIRMVFSGEDDLAIHSIAAAAYRIVGDLRKRRGCSEIPNEPVAIGFFSLAKALAEDKLHELPVRLRELAQADPQVRKMAQFIRDAKENHGQGVSIHDFQIAAIGDVGNHWRKSRLAANFLKHADRDPDESLPLSRLNTNELMLNAVASYIRLTKQITPEMQIYMAYVCSSVDFEEFDADNELDKWMSSILRATEPELRGNTCLKLLAAIKGSS
ncbi:MAG: hypothetical protein ACXW3G_10620 [Rhodoplanes sp.]